MTRKAFKEERTWKRAGTLALSSLACLGRHTVTGILAAGGQQFVDWTSAYRLFSERRIDGAKLREPLLQVAEELLPDGLPFFAAIDDTLLPKRGRHIPGGRWSRDAQGPPFATNFIWAQRFLQVACVVPEAGLASRGRAVPLEFNHAPTPKRPSAGASADQHAEYKELQAKMALGVVGRERLCALRERLDALGGGAGRQLICAVDGSYTNSTVFRHLPDRTVVVGRIRKDAKLFAPPEASEATSGRPRVYGTELPTPEEIRQDDSIPWVQVDAYATGKMHTFSVKVVGPVRWKGAGERDLQLVAVKPLSYRLTIGGRLQYRHPTYLICSDSKLDLPTLLQAYLWRWEIELSFRDQKTLLGLGEAQVRNKRSAEAVPEFVSAVYAYLHLAAIRAGIQPDALPPPAWQNHRPNKRATTAGLISLIRFELWGRALGVNKKHFVHKTPAATNPQKPLNSPIPAVIYAQK